MTKEQFQDPTTDMMEVYFFYFNLKGGQSLSFEQFRQVFSIWLINIVGMFRLGEIQYYVINQLNLYYNAS